MMKKKIISSTPAAVIQAFILIILLFSPVFGAENNVQQQFDEAGRLYEKGNFEHALELYKKVESHLIDWKLFYNMGNCYFKINQPVRAKIYYLKAQRFQPFESSIDKNIAIVNKQLNDRVNEPKPDFISRLLLRVESVVSLDILSILLVLMFLVLNWLIFSMVRKGKGRFTTYGISFSLIITIVLAGYHIYRVDKFKNREIAVITEPDAELRSGPGDGNTILFKVNPGLKVKIIDKNSSGDWLQVSSSEEIAGWIRQQSLEKI